MDSVTQFSLGAGIGVAVLGRRLGLRKAALTGGFLATLPDLDVFWPADDPVDSFVSHRSVTHSLITMTLATPVLGEGVRRLFGALKQERARVWLAVFLCLTTHALLDAMTVYGTQLFWPIWPEPLGVGSIFIIDPLYTLPLLIVTVWALIRPQWTPRFAKALAMALVASSAYLGWTVAAQQIALGKSAAALDRHGLHYDRLMATPTAFNSLFWRGIALDGARYYNVYVPLLGGDEAVTLYRQERWPENLGCWIETEAANGGIVATLANFTDGFFSADLAQERLHVADLRMGLSHTYVFRFAVAALVDGAFQPVTPARAGGLRQLPGDLDWLWAGVRGEKNIRPSEQAELLGGPDVQVAAAAQGNPVKCRG